MKADFSASCYSFSHPPWDAAPTPSRAFLLPGKGSVGLQVREIFHLSFCPSVSPLPFSLLSPPLNSAPLASSELPTPPHPGQGPGTHSSSQPSRKAGALSCPTICSLITLPFWSPQMVAHSDVVLGSPRFPNLSLPISLSFKPPTEEVRTVPGLQIPRWISTPPKSSPSPAIHTWYPLS